MERPVGSEFEVGEVTLRVEECSVCMGCYFMQGNCYSLGKRMGGVCGRHSRSDHKSVIFKKIDTQKQ